MNAGFSGSKRTVCNIEFSLSRSGKQSPLFFIALTRANIVSTNYGAKKSRHSLFCIVRMEEKC